MRKTLIGTLKRKNHRQLARVVIIPPSVVPLKAHSASTAIKWYHMTSGRRTYTIDEDTKTKPLTALTKPKLSAGVISGMTVSGSEYKPAPPRPCIARNANNISSVVASPAPRDPTIKVRTAYSICQLCQESQGKRGMQQTRTEAHLGPMTSLRRATMSANPLMLSAWSLFSGSKCHTQVRQ
jgi:hypothetical protein